MTDHNDRPLVVGGVPVASRLRTAADLAGQMVARFVAEIPTYRALPEEQLAGDVTQLASENLRLFAKVLAERRAPEPEETREIARSAAQRAEEGVPLQAVLAAYHLGIRTGWDYVTEEAGPEDVADLREATSLVFLAVQVVTGTVASAYAEEQRLLADQQNANRHTLLAALLGGREVDAAARQSGIRLAEMYTVLAVTVAPHPDESAPGVDVGVVARRKVRRVHSALAGVPDALTNIAADGGPILIPGERDRASLAGLVRRLGGAAGTDVTAAVTRAAPPQVGVASARAREILAVARATGRGPGVYELSDVLLDYQLTRSGPARTALAELLEPLAEHPDLLYTLRVHLGNDLNRKRTASELYIHPNTVDYRLRNIARLTGLDPAVAADQRSLGAALLARDVESGE